MKPKIKGTSVGRESFAGANPFRPRERLLAAGVLRDGRAAEKRQGEKNLAALPPNGFFAS